MQPSSGTQFGIRDTAYTSYSLRDDRNSDSPGVTLIFGLARQ